VLFVCVILYVDCVSLSFFVFFFFVYAAIEIFSMNKVDYITRVRSHRQHDELNSQFFAEQFLSPVHLSLVLSSRAAM